MIQRTCVRCSRPLPPIGADLLRGCVKCRAEIRERHPEQWSDDDAWRRCAYRLDTPDLFAGESGKRRFRPSGFGIAARGLLPNGKIKVWVGDNGSESWQTLNRLIRIYDGQVRFKVVGALPWEADRLATESLAPFFRHVEQWLWELEMSEVESGAG